ncbi:MAG: SGNH/GDSL hydrolase family protein [Chloroflexota bacterium]|nr:SGNH/GDSL hydrolase family protein [Chloroflexota bacterium]
MPFPLRLLSPLVLSLILAACSSSSGASPSPTHAISRRAPPSLAAPLPHSYAALGASETFGVGAVPYHRGYAYLLAHDLHARHFVDVGIPGTTLPAGYDTELTRVLTNRPALCTVFFGFNDLRAGVTRGTFLADLRDLMATLRRAGAQIIIVSLPTPSLVPAVTHLNIGNLDAIVHRWNAGMQRVARQTGAHFFDLTRFDREIAHHPGYISPDGLHPSNAGHARLAQLLYRYILLNRLWPSR